MFYFKSVRISMLIPGRPFVNIAIGSVIAKLDQTYCTGQHKRLILNFGCLSLDDFGCRAGQRQHYFLMFYLLFAEIVVLTLQ